MNSRVGVKCDFIKDERLTDLDMNNTLNDVPPIRRSMDLNSNQFGDLLIELCKAVNMCIVNGRSGMPGDKGSYTCMTHNGESVIDLVLTKYSNFKFLKQFMIHDYTEFSNHTPVSFRLKLGIVEKRETTHRIIYNRWNDEHKHAFRNDIFSEIGNLNSLLDDSDISINDKVQTFSQVITDNADKYFKKNVKCTNNTFLDRSNDRKKWFNEECIEKQRIYKTALGQYLTHRNTKSLNRLHQLKREYKTCVNRAKKTFNRDRCREMNTMRRKSPREFWRMFKTNKNNSVNEISNEQLCEHFKTLAQDHNTPDDDIEDFLRDFDEHDGNSTYEELDFPITSDEVLKACKTLNRNKSPGDDSIINEYLIETCDLLIQPLTTLFNIIFESGQFPTTWSNGIIIPL
ncbi:uncharacterized protein LOC132755774 [Ruditapes philippinarum]|uniref:uncharacterized protein LOC132755774 n=1 Tax=Ruditapes philippinarum TaxID=129788 RepID=UPI00295A707C|nr:uncharacterized protein LOC132755774 [Ruditapes philippinarum]